MILMEARRIAQSPRSYNLVKDIQRRSLSGLSSNIEGELATMLTDGWNIWNDTYDPISDVRTIELEKYMYFK